MRVKRVGQRRRDCFLSKCGLAASQPFALDRSNRQRRACPRRPRLQAAVRIMGSARRSRFVRESNCWLSINEPSSPPQRHHHNDCSPNVAHWPPARTAKATCINPMIRKMETPDNSSGKTLGGCAYATRMYVGMKSLIASGFRFFSLEGRGGASADRERDALFAGINGRL
jgi:hypothetical protein